MHYDRDEAVAWLGRTPPLLRAWLAGMPEAWLHADEGPDTFSPWEVVGHLTHGEEADWVPRLRRILEHGETVAFDKYDRFAQREQFAGWPVEKLLDRFETLRAGNLEILRGVPAGPADLQRRGMHPALGPVTLGNLLSTWVVHDFTHLAQIARVLAKQYAGEVGPWAEYFRILEPR